MARTVLLHSNHFSERGESTQFVALAMELERAWDTRVIITFPGQNPTNSMRRIKEAQSLGLEIVQYERPSSLRELALAEQVDLSLVMSDGSPSGPYYCRQNPQEFRLGNSIHVCHVVFRNFHPHGDYYLYVSDWLYGWARRNRGAGWRIGEKANVTVSTLPHGLGIPPQKQRDFRSELGIPAAAYTIARIGGFDSFNDDAAKGAIAQLVKKNENLYFVAANTQEFFSHPRIVHVDFVDRTEIRSFYKSFDLFLNGQRLGETFGYSIVEPMSYGKPVLAPHWLRNRTMNRGGLSHIKRLGLAYKDQQDLESKAQRFIDGRKVNPSTLRGRVAQYSIERFARTIVALTGEAGLAIEKRRLEMRGFMAPSVF